MSKKRNQIWSYNAAAGGIRMAMSQMDRLITHPLTRGSVRTAARGIRGELEKLQVNAKLRHDQLDQAFSKGHSDG